MIAKELFKLMALESQHGIIMVDNIKEKRIV